MSAMPVSITAISDLDLNSFGIELPHRSVFQVSAVAELKDVLSDRLPVIVDLQAGIPSAIIARDPRGLERSMQIASHDKACRYFLVPKDTIKALFD